MDRARGSHSRGRTCYLGCVSVPVDVVLEIAVPTQHKGQGSREERAKAHHTHVLWENYAARDRVDRAFRRKTLRFSSFLKNNARDSSFKPKALSAPCIPASNLIRFTSGCT
jgi:hypothetical protein